ncbi:MAG: hypothetical protein KA212_05270 [Burkholderiaceae bacterium]|nr:hypothetical protein [Burkholderiaceae bacterium]
MATTKPKDDGANATTASPAPRQMLQVIAKRDGFRRAGREWSGTTTVPLDELTKEQVEQLQAEPQLVTQLLVEAIVDTQD